MLIFFAEKNVSSFCSAKATHIFQKKKNIRILCIESAITVNEMTLNELVKLTTLWTTGPRDAGHTSATTTTTTITTTTTYNNNSNNKLYCFFFSLCEPQFREMYILCTHRAVCS